MNLEAGVNIALIIMVLFTGIFGLALLSDLLHARWWKRTHPEQTGEQLVDELLGIDIEVEAAADDTPILDHSLIGQQRYRLSSNKQDSISRENGRSSN